MKKQTIVVSLAAMLVLTSFSTVFAATDTYKIKNDGSVVINYAYDDAQREGQQGKTLKAAAFSKSPKVKAYKETLKRRNSTAETGYEYSGYGWTNLISDGKEIYHSTTTTLEFRVKGSDTQVYAREKKKGTGQVIAQTDYIQTPSEAYVYYDY